MIDAILWAFLAEDILAIENLPPPPRVPTFAAITIRPSKLGVDR